MTNAAPISSDTDQTDAGPAGTPQALDSWEQLRADGDIQFEEIEIPPPEVQEPSWFLKMLQSLFEFLGELFSPIGSVIVSIWPVLQWVLLAMMVALVLYFVARTIGPLASYRSKGEQADEEPVWQPDQAESLALLEDADRLAAEGRYDEATHLLLQRSVAQIASSRPDWVEPSSTARELSALPALSEAARSAFATMTDRVERSLFALRSLDASDWEAARGAYAEFALVKIGNRS